MNDNELWAQMPLEEFIMLADVIPLVIRNAAWTSEAFRKQYGIREGTKLLGDYNIDYVHRSQVENILTATGENIISLFPMVFGLLDQQSLEAAGIIQIQHNPYLDLRGRGVLIGFVDTGIDYTMDAFQYEDGTTKIKSIWDQTLQGASPERFHFGTEFSEDQINAALRSDKPRTIVPHTDTVGHGTFLASIAASREEGEYIGAAPDAEIIAVKLKRAGSFFYEQYLIPQEQENAYMSIDVMLGIQYIIEKAAAIGRPVAICLAVGTNMSGHDGYSLTEEYLERLATTTGVALTLAAGNESQAGHHIHGKMDAQNETKTVELLVNEAEHDLYVTMWNVASDRMAVSVRSPAGELIPKIPVRSGSSYASNLILERSKVVIEYHMPIRGSGDQATLIKLYQPTPGIWTITVHGEIVLEGTYHIWLPLNGFVNPETKFLAPTPNYTIVTPATASGVITCGAYDGVNNALYAASSWGPTRRQMMSPDLVAPGVDVGGLYPSGPGQMSGTSVAAAVTTGACALLLQWGIVDKNDVSLTTNRIRADLIRGSSRDDTLRYPNTQWGYGKLNLFNALSIMRPI